MKATMYFSFLVALSLAGCASQPVQHSNTTFTMSKIKSTDYGSYPKDYEQRIHQDLQNRLLDYDSAKIKIIMPPKKTFEIFNNYSINDKLERRISSVKGKAFYAVCVNVNAKNSYGGYTGWQTSLYKMWNNELEYSAGETYFCNKAMNNHDDIFIDKLSDLAVIVQ
ncbi:MULTISPECIES: hypothetical protein [unclassified Moraxella]|uniref:hypothetical protein n=1 Tax=unclassified Moraxella TaxID=2685852 RepID=UPI003AF926C4